MNLEWEFIEEKHLKDSISSLLINIDKLEKNCLHDLVTTIYELLMCNPRITSSIFNVLLFYLERSDEVARTNIIHVIHKLVIKQDTTNTIHDLLR